MSADVLLVGARGFGTVHRQNLARLGSRVRLIGVVDPQGAPDDSYGSDAPSWTSLDAAFESGLSPDVVIIATPTNTHYSLASLALEHGSDVYLEKPPVASMEQFDALCALQEQTGRAVQVGFQSFGSHALTEIAAFGLPTSVATWASWTRDTAYWTRSAWAGRRTLNGEPVVDGVLTNALSHAIATALRIAGARKAADVTRVELDLYRANAIEADDTSSVRITLQDSRVVSAALTLAGAKDSTPLIEVRTEHADLTLAYTTDELIYPDGSIHRAGRTDLFEELLDHRQDAVSLSAPLIDTGAYMVVLEAVRAAEPPTPILPSATTIRADCVAVDDVADWVERSARAGSLFRELQAPFASAAPPSRTERLLLGDRTVIERDDGQRVAPTSAPRPFLHPVRTLGGVSVTDAHPSDHDWHLGISFGVQHANGTNFWGGPTFVRDRGYRWLDDHGRIETTNLRHDRDGFDATTLWRDRSGEVLLTERTRWRIRGTADPRVWAFRVTTELRAGSEPVELGSPGTHGRVGAGYGGFSWRLPAVADVDVRTADASGEHAVHGTRSSWLAFSAQFPEGEATVVLAPGDRRTADDPWFVRVSDYPGIGSALAWQTPVLIPADDRITRAFRGLVADGRLTDAEITELLAE